jgi:hypothetical protein
VCYHGIQEKGDTKFEGFNAFKFYVGTLKGPSHASFIYISVCLSQNTAHKFNFLQSDTWTWKPRCFKGFVHLFHSTIEKELHTSCTCIVKHICNTKRRHIIKLLVQSFTYNQVHIPSIVPHKNLNENIFDCISHPGPQIRKNS